MEPKLINIERIILQPFKKNIFSLIRGGIDKLYMRMYQLAEDLAIHEMKKYGLRLQTSSLYRNVIKREEREDFNELQEKISKYREERLQFHMNEMKNILFKYLETEQNKKFEELMEKYFKSGKTQD